MNPGMLQRDGDTQLVPVDNPATLIWVRATDQGAAAVPVQIRQDAFDAVKFYRFNAAERAQLGLT